MSLFLEVFLKGSFFFDALGVIGLGLLGLAAVRLSRRYQSWGGSLLAGGALLVLVGRLWALMNAQFLTAEVQASLGDVLETLVSQSPLVLLTMGLAGVVWGLWGHEQWLREER
jgi:hypothetical protein